jgi:hypothetical protein
MRIYQDGPRRHYADVLRAIGASLDPHPPRALVLAEVDDGFLLRATLVAATGSRRAGAGVERVEHRISDGLVTTMVEACFAGRTAGQPAGDCERSLWAIGHGVDQAAASDILVILHDGEWLVRRLPAGSDGRYEFVELGPDDIGATIAELEGGSRGRMRLFGR